MGLALFAVLNTLAPVERLAFVLHDVFAIPFDQIAPIVDRTPQATRKLASRARRRINDAGRLRTRTWWLSVKWSTRSSPPDARRLRPPGVGAVSRRRVARRLRSRCGPLGAGASAVAGLAQSYALPEREVRPATVNGAAGAVVFVAGRPPRSWVSSCARG
ncbi:sigma-70, region 4 family protein [Mycobacterium xenopi 3993]|nr:sigma-70, region 4 family protein [Mycobacterium xenopi 3993]